MSENGREHECGPAMRRNLHVGLGVGAVDDRAGAANGLGAVVDGCVCPGWLTRCIETYDLTGQASSTARERSGAVIDENDVPVLDVDEAEASSPGQ